jgi:hypothetical protein
MSFRLLIAQTISRSGGFVADKKRLKELCAMELSKARNAEGPEVWTHLERAHVLSQPLWDMHFFVHMKMLTTAFAQKKFIEFLGQIPRLVLAAPSSALNLAPFGNPGTIRVGMFDKFDVPPDLKELL